MEVKLFRTADLVCSKSGSANTRSEISSCDDVWTFRGGLPAVRQNVPKLHATPLHAGSLPRRDFRGPRCPIEALSECRVAWTDFGSYFPQRLGPYRNHCGPRHGVPDTVLGVIGNNVRRSGRSGTLTAIPNPATHDGASVKSFHGNHRVGPSLLCFLAELNELAVLEKGRQR